MAERHEDNLNCAICGERFNSEQELNRHNLDVHSQTASPGIGGTAPESQSNINNYRRDEERDDS